MKFFTFLLMAGFLNCITTYDWNSEMKNVGLLQAFLIEFMSRYHWNCPYSVKKKLENEHRKALDCIKIVRLNSSFCNTFVNHFTPCVQAMLHESQKCEKPEDYAMTNMILESVVEEMRYICFTDGEHLFELFHPCVLNSVKRSDGCRKNVTKTLGFSMTTNSICSIFPGSQKCFEDEMDHECGNESTKTALHDFFSIKVKPCNIIMQMYFEIVDLIHFS